MATFETLYNKEEDVIGYRAQIRISGFKRESKVCRKLTDVKKWALYREAEIREGRQQAEELSRQYTLENVIERYKTKILPHKTTKEKSKTMQLIYLQHWQQKLGAYTLHNITPAVLKREQENLLIKVKASTVNRYFAMLNHVFNIAQKEWNILAENPLNKIKNLKEPRGRVRFLTETELLKLLNCAKIESPLLHLFVIMAVSTGARKSEILSLKWADIDFENNKAILHETKNNERRSIYFYGKAELELKKRKAFCRKGFKYVFSSRYVDEPVNIYNYWYKAVSKAGIKDFRVHDLRHCYATELARQGATLTELAELLGHKSYNMVKKYAHHIESHSKKIVKKMNEGLLTEKEGTYAGI